MEKIPLKRLLTETDNPGDPASYQGIKGMPILIRIVIDDVAKIKGKTPIQMEGVVRDFKRLVDPFAL